MTGSRDAAFSVVKQLKCLAFSVFSRCRKSLQLNINAKSLTGFGPAARHEALLRQREVMINLHIYSNAQNNVSFTLSGDRLMNTNKLFYRDKTQEFLHTTRFYKRTLHILHSCKILCYNFFAVIPSFSSCSNMVVFLTIQLTWF